MYISIKLPPSFGSFNKLKAENYPFNSLFTSYLAAISRLGTSLGMDVDALVGYIEDRMFEGQRLPDIPEGDDPVNIRYKTEDPDVVAYIGNSMLTNRMAVMYIARMTLRLSASYGTSLLRLTRLIGELSGESVKQVKKQDPEKKSEQVVRPKKRPAPIEDNSTPTTVKEEMPMPKVSKRTESENDTDNQPVKPVSPSESAKAAMEALNELNELTGGSEDIVKTNPLLTEFY